MTEIGGELGKLTLDVKTRAVPGDDPGGRESVPQVMKPRTASAAGWGCRRPQTDCTGDLRKCPLGHRVPDAGAALGHEERFDTPKRTDAATHAAAVRAHTARA